MLFRKVIYFFIIPVLLLIDQIEAVINDVSYGMSSEIWPKLEADLIWIKLL